MKNIHIATLKVGDNVKINEIKNNDPVLLIYNGGKFKRHDITICVKFYNGPIKNAYSDVVMGHRFVSSDNDSGILLREDEIMAMYKLNCV